LNLLGQSRFKLLLHLVVRPRTPTELASLENRHLSDVSRSLAELRRLGLVEVTPSRSRERYYHVTPDGYMAYAALSQKLK
jgi:DNA-binding MarR family transcriptional regulator